MISGPGKMEILAVRYCRGYGPAKQSGDPKAHKQSNGIINNLVYQTPTRHPMRFTRPPS
ncbi:hypothetical protein BYT27DRAFT_7260636 [Phlegmacium glaucopus]|nr:hypothetical protein BYT27DRAFT_7260636 [Phlegmacium glaucopus]